MLINPKQDHRGNVEFLSLQANTFEETRILTGIFKAISNQGSIEVTYPANEEDEVVLRFSFKAHEEEGTD